MFKTLCSIVETVNCKQSKECWRSNQKKPACRKQWKAVVGGLATGHKKEKPKVLEGAWVPGFMSHHLKGEPLLLGTPGLDFMRARIHLYCVKSLRFGCFCTKQLMLQKVRLEQNVKECVGCRWLQKALRVSQTGRMKWAMSWGREYNTIDWNGI